MLGRVAELERLRDTLGFSKERLQGKVSEFQEKYEYNRISNTRGPLTPAVNPTPQMLTSAAAGDTSFWGEFSELEMDRYDDVNILSRSMTEISADVKRSAFADGRVHRQGGRRHRRVQQISAPLAGRKFPRRAWCLSAPLDSRLSRGGSRPPQNPAARKWNWNSSGSETELDNNIIQQISDPLVHLVRNSVAHGNRTAGAPA